MNGDAARSLTRVLLALAVALVALLPYGLAVEGAVAWTGELTIPGLLAALAASLAYRRARA